MNRVIIKVDLPDDVRLPKAGEHFYVANEHYEHHIEGLTGVVVATYALTPDEIAKEI